MDAKVILDSSPLALPSTTTFFFTWMIGFVRHKVYPIDMGPCNYVQMMNTMLGRPCDLDL